MTISKEDYAEILYRNHNKSKYTFKEVIRHIDIQCGKSPHDAYRADVMVYQLGRRFLSTVITKEIDITKSASYLYGPFSTYQAAEYCALTEHEYKGPSNDEIKYYLPYGHRDHITVEKILSNIENMSHLGFLSIYMHRRNPELVYISHCGYLENRNSILVACVETNRIYNEAHARVSLYNALQHEYNKSVEGLDCVGIDSVMYE